MDENINLPELWPGWKTIRKIGSGTYGTVYEIQRNIFGMSESAALKHICIPLSPGETHALQQEGYDYDAISQTYQDHVKSVVSEYQLMQKLKDCNNVVNCDDVRIVEHDNSIGYDIFIRMELLTTLMNSMSGSITEKTILKIGTDLCSALKHCARHNIIHRDIKPQNIFVSKNGDYKLGDFGIARVMEQTTGTATMTGTLKYMAPEVLHGEHYGATADIYSLGIVLYWLLNERRMPFVPLPPAIPGMAVENKARDRRMNGEPLPPPAHGSEALKRVVLKACAYRADDRYQTAEEMRQALEQCGTGNDPREAQYRYALKLLSCIETAEDYEKAETALTALNGYKDSALLAEQCRIKRAELIRHQREAEEERQRKAEEERLREEQERLERERKEREAAEREANYQSARTQMDNAQSIEDYEKAGAALNVLKGYKDSAALAEQCNQKLDALRRKKQKHNLVRMMVAVVVIVVILVILYAVFLYNPIYRDKTTEIISSTSSTTETASQSFDQASTAVQDISSDLAKYNLALGLKSLNETDAIGQRGEDYINDHDLETHLYTTETEEAGIMADYSYCGGLLARASRYQTIQGEECQLSVAEYIGEDLYSVTLGQYNAEGQAISHYIYDAQGQLQLFYQYEYDANGRDSQTNQYLADGTLSKFWTDEYDTTGMCTETGYLADNTICSVALYDADENIISYSSYEDGKLQSNLEYYDNGNQKSSVIYAESGSVEYVTEFYENGNEKTATGYNANGNVSFAYEYDENGNQVSWRSYNNDGQLEFSSQYNNEYDAAGNIIAQYEIEEDGSASLCRSYEYDSAGNLTQEKDGIGSDIYFSRSYEYNSAGLQTVICFYTVEGTTKSPTNEYRSSYTNAGRFTGSENYIYENGTRELSKYTVVGLNWVFTTYNADGTVNDDVS